MCLDKETRNRNVSSMANDYDIASVCMTCQSIQSERDTNVRRLDPKTRHTQHMKINEEQEKRSKKNTFILCWCAVENQFEIPKSKTNDQTKLQIKNGREKNLQILLGFFCVSTWFRHIHGFTWCTSKRKAIFFWLKCIASAIAVVYSFFVVVVDSGFKLTPKKN